MDLSKIRYLSDRFRLKNQCDENNGNAQRE